MRLSVVILFIFFLFPFKNLLGQINMEEVKMTASNHTDSLLFLYNSKKKQYLLERDTLSIIKNIVNISDIHANTGNYSQSYDGYWEALIYSKTISDNTYIDKIYRKLGMLYSIFRRGKKAEEYFELSLGITKKRFIPAKKKNSILNDTYYIMVCHNRENGNYGLAKKYLDSCRILHKESTFTNKYPFFEAEQGYINYHTGNYKEALNILLPIENHFIAKNPDYLVIFYSFLGDIYFKKNEYVTCEMYYLKALETSKKYESHKNYIPNIYQKLGDVYIKINKKDLAYKNLQQSKDLSDQLFGARNKANNSILEIKDTYRIKNEQQQKILEKAKMHELEQQQKILFLRNATLTVSIITLLLISGFVVWHLYNRRKSEQTIFFNKQKLSEEKNTEILAFKNRELTSSALQLIQKDELILHIKDKLIAIKSSNPKEISQILANIKVNKNMDWEEFNARFISINKSFYKTLSNKFPELTRRDHRLCALIKLNFSSKEISRLLGISMESVNTSRYRLRKKMHLQKTDNLSEFIARW